LLRASIASAGQDHRLGANEAPPAIISIFMGAELEKVFLAIEAGKTQASKPGSFLGLGTPVLPALPLHGGDRNRTSPFAFTGNKFEFRALGSNSSPAFPNTVLNTIAAEAIDDLTEELKTALKAKGATLEKAVTSVVKTAWTANKQIVFDGDGYSEAWHKEAEKRGLANLRTTPEALPWLTDKQSIATFKKYKVLSKRELESREEVFTEQYVTIINIESETAAAIARTMLLPASVRHLLELKASGLDELIAEVEPVVKELHYAIVKLEDANLDENHPEDIHKEALYMRDTVIPAMDDVREVADRLEKVVADDLWPLPKYSEMLFIK
jgi:glutamine synthetase